MDDFLFRGELEELDPAVYQLSELEAERQFRRLILIPSESTAPAAVRQALSTAFHNIYAEGYPHESTRKMSEQQLLDYEQQLAHYRRYSDPRYYKGVEFADIIEALARRRAAVLLAANGLEPEQLYINVQPLSGAPANNAVYQALVEPGETVLGMDLMQGGHLTHGSPVNRSGKLYHAVHYGVDPDSERIDYSQVEALAQQHRPKLIIAGYSSYPWTVDWERFAAIAHQVDAYLLADIAHIAGPIAAKVIPSPVGLADVVTFTTHKSICGPRGAVALTHLPDLARMLDRAVFPGEQGGPHMNTIAAQAVAFKLANTDQFRQLQRQILSNSVALIEAIQSAGFRIPFGGTDTHMSNVDCSSVAGPDGTPLSGDQAARILDLAGIVVNRNTIPGDRSAARPSGIRLGTVWITQRGYDQAECREIGQLIARLLQSCTPYSLTGGKRGDARAKVDFELLGRIQQQVAEIAARHPVDYQPGDHGYPHFYRVEQADQGAPYEQLEVFGDSSDALLGYVTDARPRELAVGQELATRLHLPDGPLAGGLARTAEGWRLTVESAAAPKAASWLRALSDGYIEFDPADLLRKPPGPVIVRRGAATDQLPQVDQQQGSDKPWHFGAGEGAPALPDFQWDGREPEPLRRTALIERHRKLGAKLIPFAGWEMPVWYSSVLEEHRATRQAAGLFDVSHMGVYQAEGDRAQAFMDCLVGNDVSGLEVGQSLYTHLLDPSGAVLDDAMIYRRGEQAYMMVVNASNDDKVWAWLQAVRDGSVRVDDQRPGAQVYGRGAAVLNLRDPAQAERMRVDIALQGPNSREILLSLGCSEQDAARLRKLEWAGLMEGRFGGFGLVVSRTGYTGERTAYELFVHPDHSPALWDKLLEVGRPLGLLPAGLGARDSLRTEAGLPLYGQEFAGALQLGVGDAGFASYVKTYKPWFIGRSAFISQERERSRQVVRFRFDEQRVRMAHYGDPVVDEHGQQIGQVTSCAIDRERYLTGQACLDRDHLKVGTPIGVRRGDQTTPASVVARFQRF